MRMFATRKPRRFQHTYIYYDDRKARLDDIERRAARDLGLDNPTQSNATERISGTFSSGQRARRQASHHVATSGKRSIIALLTLLILLLAVVALLD